MPKSRKNWREKKKARQREELIPTRNIYGYIDPVPFEAVKRIRIEQRKSKEPRG
ncbi:MAG: hypothetical protein GX824_01040 [Clostridiales bacterium]|nr:hypothetical protein [Clostridiales bacterium]